MKNRKLELKDIVGYFPYDMLFKESKKGSILRMDRIESKDKYEIWAILRDADDVNYSYLSSDSCLGEGFRLKDIKPILHPMSDLTKSIKVSGYNKGKEFIPLVELAKYDIEGTEYVLESDPDPNYGNWYVSITVDTYLEPYIYSFDKDAEYQRICLWELDFLNRWMFDYNNLIYNNLAIDINTIK